jgi:hypothetical protein
LLFSSLHLGTCHASTLNLVTASSFHILSNLLVINYSVIRRYIVWATESVVKKILTNSVAPEPAGSSPHSQEPATGPYPEPTGSTLQSHANHPKI